MENLSNQVLNMNKASLEKLSKSQLIKLLLNQQKPKKVEVKPKKQVSFNLENLFDEAGSVS